MGIQAESGNVSDCYNLACAQALRLRKPDKWKINQKINNSPVENGHDTADRLVLWKGRSDADKWKERLET
jgi:hypothetical protein